MNIYEKMLKATDEIGIIEKKIKITIGNGSYKAVGEREVIDAVKEVEKSNGIFSYPVSRKIVSQELPTTESEYEGKKTVKWSVFMRIETTYRFVNIEDPKDFLDIVSYGDGIDAGDKAPGKAMTYSDKYALLKAYKIETGDDPDKDASKEKTKTTPPPPAKKADPKPATEEETIMLCKFGTVEAINNALLDYTKKGIVFNPEQKARITDRRAELELMKK
jgi:hypothetical protein